LQSHVQRRHRWQQLHKKVQHRCKEEPIESEDPWLKEHILEKLVEEEEEFNAKLKQVEEYDLEVKQLKEQRDQELAYQYYMSEVQDDLANISLEPARKKKKWSTGED